MPKLLIGIPSKGRAGTVKRVVEYVQYLGYDWVVAVEPQDKSAYTHAGIAQQNLLVLPEDNQGLPYSKAQIARYALKNQYDYVFKLDDDIKYWQYGHGKRSVTQTIATLTEALPDAVHLLAANPLVKAVGFAYLQFMHNAPRTKSYGAFLRLQGCYVVAPQYLPGVPGATLFEDYSTTLAIWAAGYTTVRRKDVGFDADFNTLSGGLKGTDRKHMASYTLAVFKKFMPMLRLREVSKEWGYEPDMVDLARKMKKNYGV